MDPVLVEYVVTCGTDWCGNYAWPVSILGTEDAPYVVCGPCGVQITDVKVGK